MCDMKKVMILGGGPNQLGLLRTAKECGYMIVLCDKNPQCIGKNSADIFYSIDIINEEEITKIAVAEKINGILSNSEIVMEVVAKVSTFLGLIGNSREGISILNSKQEFREFQQANDIFAPKHKMVADNYNISNVLDGLKFPLIVKPVKCSGTRGTVRFDSYEQDELKKAIDSCIRFSRNKKCTIEEYIEMPSLNVLEGDVFINEGKYFWGGLYFTKRSAQHPMVPMTYMSPYLDSDNHMIIIKNTLSKMFDRLRIRHGEYNVEAYFDRNDNFFIIEINARQGGHGLPAYVKLATNVDMDKLLVTTAVGDNAYFDSILEKPYEQKFATRHTIFSDSDGVLESVYIDDRIKKYIVEVEFNTKIGGAVEKRINGSSYIGFVNLIFDSYEIQHMYSENIEEYIYPIVKNSCEEILADE